MKKQIKLQNICYETDEKVLFKNLNYIIDQEKKYVLIGENGSGKTTLLKIMNGLLNCKGKCSVTGIISYIDEFILLNKHVKVKELLNFIFEKNISNDLLVKFNINFLDTKIKNLSLGSKNKLLLLIAFNINADYIFLDELLNAIDSKTYENVIDYIIHTKKSILIVTHDSNLIKRLSKNDYILIQLENNVLREVEL